MPTAAATTAPPTSALAHAVRSCGAGSDRSADQIEPSERAALAATGRDVSKRHPAARRGQVRQLRVRFASVRSAQFLLSCVASQTCPHDNAHELGWRSVSPRQRGVPQFGVPSCLRAFVMCHRFGGGTDARGMRLLIVGPLGASPASLTLWRFVNGRGRTSAAGR